LKRSNVGRRRTPKIDWGIKTTAAARHRDILATATTIRATGPRTQAIQVEPNIPDLGPFASIPQRILTAALQKRGERVEFEIPFAGGRSKLGGMVLDLWLPNRGPAGTAIRVQGDYWHSLDPTRAQDDAQATYLRSRRIQVVDVWERDILQRLDWVLTQQIGFGQ
jgi:hypothetical protein